jgi:hypothetical protein
MTEVILRVPTPRSPALPRLVPASVLVLPGTVAKHARTQGVSDEEARARLLALLEVASSHELPAAAPDPGHLRRARRFYVGSLVLVLSEDLSGLVNVHPLRDPRDLELADASPVPLHVPTLAFTAGVLRRASGLLDLPLPTAGDQPSWERVSSTVRSQVQDLSGSWGEVTADASGRVVRAHTGRAWLVTTFAGNRQAARLDPAVS